MMNVYNSLTRRVEELKPLEGNEIRLYTCGPTVYNFAHIGNFRAYAFEDILRRVVQFNGMKIRQVMNNLMTNAVKYCGEDKKIIVTVRRDGKDAEFLVTDFGQGIKPEEVPHVWDRYYQSSTHHVRETSGTGLGLSIVKEILKLHDARYGVESKVGEGSTFWFALPIVR